MSLTIDTGITARTPNPHLTRNLPAARKEDGGSKASVPALDVNLTDIMAQGTQDAAVSTYNVSSLKALKQNFYKASIG
ncbi:MAG: hypothetical protein HOD72_06190 [Opitutae bacterium]|jgi:uncharacterized lipoprotein YajG|nr:hypothetical protein [Opitutae bacterium]MBT4224039.1 hypothetical protein [Opitutae bacterium]MBT5378443.1 hypothetical protein [Opitutae bacterium]MBT5690907.1 hypothetical protein [Opitutae bacterium]MBT6461008.1 hypothetical protein [Opitutae bacterium]